MRSLITVGVSDTPTSRAAIRWALRHAARTDSGVVLLHVIPVHAGTAALVAATLMLRQTVEEASGFAPVVTVSFRILRGGVVGELIWASAESGMLVVGGRSGSEDDAGGSPISREIAAEATCPVVVVPDTDRLFAHGVALGVADSASGRAAVAFAGSQASALRQRLTLVRAWPGHGLHDESRRAAVLEGTARRDADHMLAEVRDGTAHLHPELPIDTSSLHGSVAEVLVESSVHAQLLVLGVARRAPGSRPALGAVGSAALRHMRAPIAFVHGAYAEALSDDRDCDDRDWEDAMSEGWADLVGAERAAGARTL